MKKRIGSYPRVRIEGGGRGVVSQAGAVLLVETVRKTGLDTAISAALAPWWKARVGVLAYVQSRVRMNVQSKETCEAPASLFEMM
ncbi:hypothetical protein ACIPJT_37675, partial [Streptomyces sp. NPDC086782]